MLTSSIRKLLVSSLFFFVAFAPLLYIPLSVPERDPRMLVMPAGWAYDDDDDRACYSDCWRGYALCGHDSVPDLRGHVQTTIEEC